MINRSTGPNGRWPLFIPHAYGHAHLKKLWKDADETGTKDGMYAALLNSSRFSRKNEAKLRILDQDAVIMCNSSQFVASQENASLSF